MNAPAPLKQPLPNVAEELTTRPILESAERLKASPAIATAPPDAASKPSPERDAARAGSESRLAVQSSLVPAGGGAPVSPDAPIRVGQQFARLGPYQIVCELAAGGMASVYLTIHRSVEGFQKLCAVKRIHPHLAGDRAFNEMFVDEAQIAARISHPYVCSVFSFGRSQDSHYIAMEFLRGEPLSAIFRRVGRMPELGDDPRFPLLAARVLANLAEGLHAAHTLRDDRGALLEVVHRDVTPQNLFVLYDGSVRVTDFGIAQARQRLHHTQGQKLKGKLSYIAPELLNHGRSTAQVDVWGLGVVLWELLAGRRLFLGSSEGETVASVMSRVVKAPSEFRAAVPAELDRIVLRALDRDLERRYRSARDFARALERFLEASGDSVPAMDVADWMARVFPEGAERIQGLTELAAHVAAATADETVVRVPSSPPGPSIRDLLPSLPTLPVATTVYQPAEAGESDEETVAAKPGAQAPAVAAEAPTAAAEAPTAAAPTVQVSKARAPAAGSLSSRRLGWAVVATLLSAAAGFALTLLVAERRVTPPLSGPVAGEPVERGPAVQVVEVPPVVGVAARVIDVDSLPVLMDEPEQAAAEEPESATERTSAPLRRPVSSAKPAPVASSISSAVKRATGEVYVTTPGGSAEVSAEGRPLGRTPGRFHLSPGQHQLLLTDGKGARQAVSVTVVAGSATLITVPLVR